MKKPFSLAGMLLFANFITAQLTVTTNPLTSTSVCSSNSVTITATATPISYTLSSITYNAYDPSLYSTNVLVDDNVGTYTLVPHYFEPLSSGNLDDGRWENIALPFSFRFYGSVFNTIHITTNGWIGMGSTNTTSTGLGATIPAAALPNNVIHAITSDLTFSGNVPANSTTTTAALQYFTVGTAPNRRFVVDYRALKFLSASGTASVQVILHETTNIVEIHTLNCTNTTYTKSQGVENGTGSSGTAVTGRNNATTWSGAANTAYRFTPDVINYSWSPATGLNTTTGATVIATPATNTTYTVTATNASNGQTGNTTVAVNVNPASYTLAAAAGGAQICQNISVSASGTNYRDGNCNLIANLQPTGGATALTNSVNTCVKVETAASTMGTTDLYLARHYDIDPIVNAATATANVTLYYTQAEFDNYNTLAAANNKLALPTGPADATGISNVILRQFHGTGTNPTNYTGAAVDFTTATAGFTITWNATRSWWEVVIPVNGFSGFYITSGPLGVLPVSLEYFRGSQNTNGTNRLNWKVNCTAEKVHFDIERSTDNRNYYTIGNIVASQLRCAQPFESTDDKPAAGINYYRIKITDEDGYYYYSNTISFNTKVKGFIIESLSPNPVKNENAVLRLQAGDKSAVTIAITDFAGRVIVQQNTQILPGLNNITMSTQLLTSGIYQVTVYVPGQKSAGIKLIKQ
jgi:hypothetical protein